MDLDQSKSSSVSGHKEQHSRMKDSRKTHEISDNDYSDVSSEEQDCFSSDSEEEGEIKSTTTSSLFKDLANDVAKDSSSITKTGTESTNLDKLDKLSQEFEAKVAYGPKVNDKLVKTVNLGLLIVLGFNDTSTLEGHFVSSPREREKRDRRESRGDERDREKRGTGMKVKKQKK